MSAPLWQVRLAAEREAQMQLGQRILTEGVRKLTHLTPEESAEAERLIALPYGAESCALRRFILDHGGRTSTPLAVSPSPVAVDPVARRMGHACEEAGRLLDRALPDAEALTGPRRLTPEVQAAWSLAALCHQLGDMASEGTDAGAVANRLADVERIAGDLVAAAREIAAAATRPRVGARPTSPAVAV